MKTQLQLNIRSRGAMSGVLTMGSLDPAFAAATRVDAEPVVVDLRTVEFVEPAGLCGLAALLEYLSARCDVVDLALAGCENVSPSALLCPRSARTRPSMASPLSGLTPPSRHPTPSSAVPAAAARR